MHVPAFRHGLGSQSLISENNNHTNINGSNDLIYKLFQVPEAPDCCTIRGAVARFVSLATHWPLKKHTDRFYNIEP